MTGTTRSDPFELYVKRTPEHVTAAEITVETIPALLELLLSEGIAAKATLPGTPEDTYFNLSWDSTRPDGSPCRYVAGVGDCIVRVPDGRYIRMRKDAFADYYTRTARAVDLALLDLTD